MPRRSSPKPEGEGRNVGMSLSGYLLKEFREIAARPTLSEFRKRLHARESIPDALDTARLLREDRAVR